MSNTILNVHGLPLKHIITKNKKSIELLKDTGSLIVYEPENSDYRELYLGSYFLASGFGAKSREEQNNLSYLSNSYNDIYAYLDNRINDSFAYSYSLYGILDKNKVDRGNNNLIDEFRNVADDIDKYDLSYNVMQFGTTKNDLIYLYELYDRIHSLHILQKLEITKVKYTIRTDDGVEYPNYSYIPYYTKIKDIIVTISGNTNDANGISQVYIEFNDNVSNTTRVINMIDNLDLNNSTPAITSNQSFELKLYKNFGKDYIYQILSPENHPINHIQLNINSSSTDVLTLNKLSAELRDIIDSFDLVLYGAPFIWVLKKDVMINNIYYEDQSDIQLTTYYKRQVLLNNSNYGNSYQSIIEISKNDTNNQFPSYISILIPNDPENTPLNMVRLIKAEYIDQTTNNIYDITHFILFRKFKSSGNQNYIQYIFDSSFEPNENYNNIANPPFITPILDENDKPYNFTLNEGKIILTFINSSSNIDILFLKNSSEYWINYSGTEINFPLSVNNLS